MTASQVNIYYEWWMIYELNLPTVIRMLQVIKERNKHVMGIDYLDVTFTSLYSVHMKTRLWQASIANRLKYLLSWTLMSLQVCEYLLGITVRAVITDCWYDDSKQKVYFVSDRVSFLGKRRLAENIIMSYGSVTEVQEKLSTVCAFMILKKILYCRTP